MQNEIIAEEVSEIGLADPTIEVQPAVVEVLGNELVYAQNNIARKMIEIENLLKNLQSVLEQGSTALYHLMKAAEAGEPDEKYAMLNRHKSFDRWMREMIEGIELLKITYHGYEESATIAGFINYAASESSLNFK
jgi:hypothetical protein